MKKTKNPGKKQTIWHYLALWGTICVILGVLLYKFAIGPMFYQATTFSGGGAISGLRHARQELADSGVTTEESVIKVILGWVNFALPFAAVFAFIGIVYAGFLYVTNFTNEEAAGKAKTIIFLSILGLIIIFSAYAIVSTVLRATA